MKKITIMLSVIGLLLAIAPMNASATEMKQVNTSTNQAYYGTITVMESNGWESKPDGGKFITQVYYVTKTVGDYVYLMLNETNNVKITSILPGSSFEKVKETPVDGGVQVLLKAKGNITGKTEAITVLADIVDPTKLECNLSYSLLNVVCFKQDDLYIDKNGKQVTKDEYDKVCNGVTPTDPDVPSPDTGSVIPYLAVGGGLIAVAGVYFYSRKSNKMYKI